MENPHLAHSDPPAGQPGTHEPQPVHPPVRHPEKPPVKEPPRQEPHTGHRNPDGSVSLRNGVLE